jgi:hypothetical protein
MNNLYRKLVCNIGVVCLLGLIAFASCGQLLILPHLPHTPNDDLARHAAFALNFREALREGQFIPRLQPNPDDFPDSPVFKYYGFLSAAVSQIGLRLGIPAFKAVVLAVTLCRMAGLLVLFFMLRAIGVSIISSIIACCAYVSFPYIQTNLYGRVAMAESCSHGLLPFIFAAYAYLFAGKGRVPALLLSAAGTAFMALSHPIFLLWGTASLLLLAATARLVTPEDGYRRSAMLVIGAMLGLAVSAFQWYPAFISSGDLDIRYTGSSPFGKAYLTSLSGFFGLPEKFACDATAYYFTGAAWVLPIAIVAAFFLAREERLRKSPQGALMMASLLNLAVFLFLSVSPINVWHFLPRMTYGTQFPYRLLAFVALSSAILLAPVTLSGTALAAPACITASRLPEQTDAELVSAYSCKYYSASVKGSLTWSDRWLLKDNIVFLAHPEKERRIWVHGLVSDLTGLHDLSLWFASPKPHNPRVSEILKVKDKRFEHMFTIRKGVKAVRLMSSDYVRLSDIAPPSRDTRLLSVIIDDLNPGAEEVCHGFVGAHEVKCFARRGYRRRFLPPPVVADRNTAAPVVLMRPLAYSRVNSITPGGSPLPARPGYNGLTRLVVHNTTTSIRSTYRPPLVSTVVSILAFLILLGLCIYVCLKPRAERYVPRRRARKPPDTLMMRVGLRGQQSG